MIKTKHYKQPISVLVIIYNDQQQILLLERADKPGFWQSVTGSLEAGESLLQTAQREVAEETGICVTADAIQDWQQTNEYEIYAYWRHRYAPGVTHNTEHVFSVCVRSDCNIELSAQEHLKYGWYTREEAIEIVFSPSNQQALIQLPHHW